MKTRYFHGSIDTYQAALGAWRVTNREQKYLHTVQHARRVLYQFSGHTHPYAEKLIGELINRDPEEIEPLRDREGFESVPVHQEVCPRLQSNVPPFLRIKRGFCLILSSIGHVRESSVVPALARSDLEIIIFFPAERV